MSDDATEMRNVTTIDLAKMSRIQRNTAKLDEAIDALDHATAMGWHPQYVYPLMMTALKETRDAIRNIT